MKRLRTKNVIQKLQLTLFFFILTYPSTLFYGELCISGKKCLTSGTIKIYNMLSNKKPLFILEVFVL